MDHPALSLPPSAGLPPPRDWLRLACYGLRATLELALARIAFARITVPAILAGNAAVAGLAQPPAGAALPAWITYTMPRAARRLPFRSDCLVQALAARRWLARAGYASAIVIGAERPGDGPFGAHAWLTSGEAVITGGEIQRYTKLL